MSRLSNLRNPASNSDNDQFRAKPIPPWNDLPPSCGRHVGYISTNRSTSWCGTNLVPLLFEERDRFERRNQPFVPPCRLIPASKRLMSEDRERPTHFINACWRCGDCAGSIECFTLNGQISALRNKRQKVHVLIHCLSVLGPRTMHPVFIASRRLILLSCGSSVRLLFLYPVPLFTKASFDH